VRALLIALAGLLATAAAAADPAAVTLPTPLFGDHMVLQQGRAVPVWGSGSPPGGEVTVLLNGQTKVTTVMPDGSWRVDLDAMGAGGPHQLEVVGSNHIVIDDVMIGEVWLACGQSNMAREVVPAVERVSYPLVRALRHQGWDDNPSETAWFLGRYLFDARQVPIGIINRAVGSSNVRDWLPDDAAQDLSPELVAELGPFMGRFFREHIEPLVPYAIRGVFWWQGESDRSRFRAIIYGEQLVALIRSWRRAFGQGDFPFLYVELPTGHGVGGDRETRPLPPYPSPVRRPAVLLYDAYLSTLLSEPVTGMAVTKDLGNGRHPALRAPYAERLVLWARHLAYGESVVYSGPIVQSVTREGERLRIRFRDGTAEGLHGFGSVPVQGFALSEDGVSFAWAEVEIQGAELVVWRDDMTLPTVVRYAWDARTLWANLVNGADMAAAPFSIQVP
jgi:sialate O-acetylesterase